MIPRSILGRLIGRTWRTFVGTSHDELSDTVEQTLTDLGWAYDRKSTEPASGERSIFGAEDATRFELADEEWALTVTSVSYDPLLRGLLSLSASGDTKSKYTTTACLIDVRPLSKGAEPRVEVLLQEIAASLETDPWSIDHPRFNYSPLLRYKVKLLWQYWLSPADRANGR